MGDLGFLFLFFVSALVVVVEVVWQRALLKKTEGLRKKWAGIGPTEKVSAAKAEALASVAKVREDTQDLRFQESLRRMSVSEEVSRVGGLPDALSAAADVEKRHRLKRKASDSGVRLKDKKAAERTQEAQSRSN